MGPIDWSKRKVLCTNCRTPVVKPRKNFEGDVVCPRCNSPILIEKNVEEKLVGWFRDHGHKVCVHCNVDPTDFLSCHEECSSFEKVGKVTGVDLVARKPGEVWVVEVKGEGGSSADYEVNLADALFQILRRMGSLDPRINYAIALPWPSWEYAKHDYNRELGKLAGSAPLKQIPLKLILVEPSGGVQVKTLNEFLTSLT